MTHPLVHQQIEKIKESSFRHNQTSSSPSKCAKKDVMKEQNVLKREKVFKSIDVWILSNCQIQTQKKIPSKCKDKTEYFVLLVIMIMEK